MLDIIIPSTRIGNNCGTCAIYCVNMQQTKQAMQRFENKNTFITILQN